MPRLSTFFRAGASVTARVLWISSCVRLKGGSNPLSRINLISAPLAGWGAPTGGKAHTDVQRTANAKIVGSNPTLPSRHGLFIAKTYYFLMTAGKDRRTFPLARPGFEPWPGRVHPNKERITVCSVYSRVKTASRGIPDATTNAKSIRLNEKNMKRQKS